jgi:hypothetical protein
MNNSLARLIDGMVATLRQEVIPHTQGEFARGQAFGLIYMLNSIRLRADWSPAFVGEQLAALRELGDTLEAQGVEAARLPELPTADVADLRTLEAARDQGDQRVCELIDWLDAQRDALPAERAGAIDQALRHYMNRQIRWELTTSARPMFAEISSGCE